MSKQITNIAVIRLSAMGDVAMTVPVLLAISQQYPALKITMVTRKLFRPFFETIPNVNFFEVDTKERHKGFFGLFRLYKDLRKENIDAVADLHNVIRSNIVSKLFAFGGYPVVTIDKARKEKRALTRPEAKEFRQIPTAFERHLTVFKSLGFTLTTNPKFLPKQEISPEVSAVTGSKFGSWIGIAPFAQHDPKVYPADLMHEVILGLSQKAHKIFLFGAGESELAQLEVFASATDNVIVVANKMSLQKELELISNLDLMLSMDSANGHIAAMFGVKVVTLWGATHPYAGFAPFLQPMENSLLPDRAYFPKLPTSTYGNKIVKGYEDAMRTIAPSSVIEKVLSLL